MKREAQQTWPPGSVSVLCGVSQKQFPEWRSEILRTVSKGLFMFAGLLAAPVIPRAQYTTPTAQSVGDPRLVRLQRFLHDNNCPIKRLAGDFIEAADHHELDWRLLPSIAVIESGGGKRYKNNNVFGWDNGRERFPSVRAGIHIVARKLANSPMYKDKDTEHILRTYNPKRQDYSRRVKAVMELIALREEYAGGLN